MKARTIAAPLLGLVLAASACAAAPTPSIAARPEGAHDLFLRVDTEGGFVSPTVTLGRVPSFSLFGDGTAVTTGVEPAIYPSAALPSLLQTSIDPAGVRALVAAALRAGLGHDRDLTDLGSTGIADATTTVFTSSWTARATPCGSTRWPNWDRVRPACRCPSTGRGRRSPPSRAG